MGQACEDFGAMVQTPSGRATCRADGARLTWQPVDAWRSEGRFDPAPLQPEAPFSGQRMAGASRKTCANAWWDTEFANVIPQLRGSGQSAALSKRIWRHCHEKYGLYMRAGERDRLYRQWFAQVGQLVADEISSMSARTGMSICDAMEAVLKPHYSERGFGLIGWDKSSFLRILYRQWQGGPMVGKVASACQEGDLRLQFRRHYEGRHEGEYWPALGTPGATWPISKGAERASWVPAGVCVAWMLELGNAGVGAKAVVTGFTYHNLGDGIDFFNADNEVVRCGWRAKVAIGLPVDIKPQTNLGRPFTVTPEQSGIWHGMSNCAWRLTPVDGSQAVEWNPGSKAFTVIELRAGDQFATTCELRRDGFDHFEVIPAGLFPLDGPLSPGTRTPARTGSCRYAIVDVSALRNPDLIPLQRWTGQPIRGQEQAPDDARKRYIHSKDCGYWSL